MVRDRFAKYRFATVSEGLSTFSYGYGTFFPTNLLVLVRLVSGKFLLPRAKERHNGKSK